MSPYCSSEQAFPRDVRFRKFQRLSGKITTMKDKTSTQFCVSHWFLVAEKMDRIHYIHIIFFFFLLKTQHFFPPAVTAAIQCLLMPSTTQVTTELDSNWEPQWHCCFIEGTREVPRSFLGREDHKGSVPLLLYRHYFGVWKHQIFAPSPDPFMLCSAGQVFMCKLNICIAIQDRHFCCSLLDWNREEKQDPGFALVTKVVLGTPLRAESCSPMLWDMH